MKKELNEYDLISLTLGHLVYQGTRSYDKEKGSCMYRASGNLKCAAGFWVPDELYHYGMEFKNIKAVSEYLDPQYEWSPELIKSLRNLQDLHDDAKNWMSMDTFFGAINGYMIAYSIKDIVVNGRAVGSNILYETIQKHWKGKKRDLPY